eukprot:scaffold442_cov268-Pinguiococcus_pyrenoidosus.AAC.89
MPRSVGWVHLKRPTAHAHLNISQFIFNGLENQLAYVLLSIGTQVQPIAVGKSAPQKNRPSVGALAQHRAPDVHHPDAETATDVANRPGIAASDFRAPLQLAGGLGPVLLQLVSQASGCVHRRRRDDQDVNGSAEQVLHHRSHVGLKLCKRHVRVLSWDAGVVGAEPKGHQQVLSVLLRQHLGKNPAAPSRVIPPVTSRRRRS